MHIHIADQIDVYVRMILPPASVVKPSFRYTDVTLYRIAGPICLPISAILMALLHLKATSYPRLQKVMTTFVRMILPPPTSDGQARMFLLYLYL